MMGGLEQVMVFARWTMAPEALGTVVALVAEVRKRSLEQPGCLGYEILWSIEDPRALVIVERYRDDAALEAQWATKHYREVVVERILPMLTDRRVNLFRLDDPGCPVSALP